MVCAITIHRVNLYTGYQPKDVGNFQVRFSELDKILAVLYVRHKRIILYVDGVVGHTSTVSGSSIPSSINSAGVFFITSKQSASYKNSV